MKRLVDELRQTLPPVFAGTSLDVLTGGAIRWPTIQNKRSARAIPDECFIRSGTRVLVVRDPFFDWWSTTLSEARQPFTIQRRRRPTDEWQQRYRQGRNGGTP
jgi:putative SOS response-associated peptidase YedK